MKIDYNNIPEQEIVNLIAWFAREKGNEVVIHTEDGDIILRYEQKPINSKQMEDVSGYAVVAACAACL